MSIASAALALTPAQAFDAWAGIRSHLVSVCVGILSVVLALTVPIEWIWLAGMIYMLQAPLHWRNGLLIERARTRAFPAPTE
ncbi:MAG TPA: hypothetical protein VFZ38_01980 [Vicinamibacterales bacterium]|jgi:hypothetical protein